MFQMDDIDDIDVGHSCCTSLANNTKQKKKKKFRPKHLNQASRGTRDSRAPHTPHTPRRPAPKPVRVSTADSSRSSTTTTTTPLSKKQARSGDDRSKCKRAAAQGSLERATNFRVSAPVFVPSAQGGGWDGGKGGGKGGGGAAPPMRGCLRDVLTSAASPASSRSSVELQLPKFNSGEFYGDLNDSLLFGSFTSVGGRVSGSACGSACGSVGGVRDPFQTGEESKGGRVWSARETKSASPASHASVQHEDASPAPSAPALLLIPLKQAQREANDLETDVRVNLVAIQARGFTIGPSQPDGAVGMDKLVYGRLCDRLDGVQRRTGARTVVQQCPDVWGVWKKTHDQLVEMRRLLLTLPTKTFVDSVRHNPFKASDERVPDPPTPSLTEA